MSKTFDIGRFCIGVIGASAVVLFFSEYVFFNEEPALAVLEREGLATFLAPLPLLLLYCLTGLVWAAALSAFDVRSVAAIVLSGCLFGWAIEAMLVPAVYEAVPVSLIWTSVAWHMPIDVLWGLFALTWGLRRGLATTALLTLLTGCFWGYWATWVTAEGIAMTVFDFGFFALATTPLLVIGLFAFSYGMDALFRLPRLGQFVAGFVALFLLIANGWPHPIGLAYLFGLLAVTCLALHRSGPKRKAQLKWRRSETLRPLNCAILAFTPVIATGAFWLCEQNSWVLPISEVASFAFLLSIPILFASWVIAFTRH